MIAGNGVDGPLGMSEPASVDAKIEGQRTVVVATEVGVAKYPSVYAAPFASAISANAPWHQIFGPEDKIASYTVAGDQVFALSDRDAARRTIVRRSADGSGALSVVAAESRAYRTDIYGNSAGSFVAERDGATMKLQHFDIAGNSLGTVALPTANVILELAGSPDSDIFDVHIASFNDAGHWYQIEGSKAQVRDLSLDPPVPPVYAKVHVDNGFAKSADGTLIPVTIVYADGTPRDGRRPMLVFGYGAYGRDVLEPPAPPYVLPLFDFGVVQVLAHVRGGGEYGEPWHLAGKGPTKQHTIDDFVACAKYAIDAGWTSPVKLAGLGGSAGGITIGGAITQHPELFAAAISQVGTNDMVDYERTPNCLSNVPEFGSVATADGFRNLLAMSAYDHVLPGTRYPAVMLTTGLNHPRVAPWEVAKMTARLQAATKSGKPVLLRADEQAGHGVAEGVASTVNECTDLYTFMLWQLGEPGFQM